VQCCECVWGGIVDIGTFVNLYGGGKEQRCFQVHLRDPHLFGYIGNSDLREMQKEKGSVTKI
jgi:hypothetical protein